MSEFIEDNGIRIPVNLYGKFGVSTLFPKENISDFEEKNKELISKIVDTHDSISRPISMLTKAMWIGEMLIKQKKEIYHGEFSNFIKRNFSFSERTAQNYMGLYKNKNKIEKAKAVSMREAYQLISGTNKQCLNS